MGGHGRPWEVEFKTRHTNIMCRSPWEAMGGGDFKRNSLGLIEGLDISIGGHGRWRF